MTSGPGSRRVYPRAHGGNRASISAMSAWNGLSPHAGGPTDRALDPVRMGSIPAARGKRQTGLLRIFDERSILAHGGNSLRCSRSALVSGLSPRTRGWGENYATSADVGRRSGISPRTQGKRQHDVTMEIPVRSIPAHAGEKSGHRPEPTRRESIPAHAGGTGREIESVRVAGVYPRLRAGSPSDMIKAIRTAGPSLHTRGEHS